MVAACNDKLGDLCVQNHLITRAQLNHALHVQKRQVKTQRVGDILVDLGYLSRDKVRKVIEEHGRRELFGEMLVHQGVLSREQLDQALAQQAKSGRRLGEVLRDLRLLDDEKLARALSHQLDISYLVPRPGTATGDAFKRLSAEFMRDRCVVPIAESEGTVTVLASDPASTSLKHALAEKLHAKVEFAVGTRASIEALIDGLILRERFGQRVLSTEVASGDAARVLSKLVIRSSDMTTQDPNSGVSVFEYLIWDALKQKASDIHIEPQQGRLQVRYRIDGFLARQCEFPLELAKSMFQKVEVLAHMDTDSMDLQREGLIQAEVDGECVDLRLAINRSVLGKSMTIRLFSQKSGLMDLGSLGMPPRMLATYRHLVEQGRGLILITGPKATGKTTTLYSTLQLLNDGTNKIITIESPVASILDGIAQTSISASRHAAIPAMISSFLQHDPDIIALGELATPDAIESLLKCATMGTRVFATSHADDSAAALLLFHRLETLSSLLSSCAIVILAQRLVRKICVDCSREYMPSAETLRRFPYGGGVAEEIRFRQGSGCMACRGTGFVGRTGIYELLVVGPELREALQKRASPREIRALARKSPTFISLKQAGFLKACQGITTLEEVWRILPSLEREGGEEVHDITTQELCRRTGIDLTTNGERQDHGMVSREPQTKS